MTSFNPKQPGFYNPAMLGPGLLNSYAVSVFDAFDRMRFEVDAAVTEINGKTQTFFQVPIGSSYTPLGNATPITKDNTDTNWDLSGQTQYGYLFEGLSIGVGTLQGVAGSAASDMTLLTNTLNTLVNDTAYELFVNDTSMDRGKVAHAPAAGGLAGFNATGSNPIAANGVTAAGNYKSYAQAPLWIPVNQRLKVVLTHGKRCVSANFGYKPATTDLFFEVRLIGRRVTMTGA